MNEVEFEFLEKSFVKGSHNSPKQVLRVLYKNFSKELWEELRINYYISFNFYNMIFKNDDQGLSQMLWWNR